MVQFASCQLDRDEVETDRQMVEEGRAVRLDIIREGLKSEFKQISTVARSAEK